MRSASPALDVSPDVNQRLNNLPRQMTSFIGRQVEIAEIQRLLCDEPSVPVGDA